MLKKFIRTPFGLWFTSSLLALIITLIVRSMRWREVGLENLNGLESADAGPIFASWHEYVFCAYKVVPLPVVSLQSPHPDGKVLAYAFQKLGIQPVFASSNRNPLSGLKELASASKAGARLVISPDGPRGPARQMAMGPVAVAQLTGAPIIPILWSCDRFWRVNSWDRLRIPKPFSKAVRVIGQPIYLPPTSDKTAREAQRVMVEEQLNALVKTADEMMGVAE